MIHFKFDLKDKSTRARLKDSAGNVISQTGEIGADNILEYKDKDGGTTLVSVDTSTQRATFDASIVAKLPSDVQTQLASETPVNSISIKNIKVSADGDLEISFSTTGGKNYDFKLDTFNISCKETSATSWKKINTLPPTAPAHIVLPKNILTLSTTNPLDADYAAGKRLLLSGSLLKTEIVNALVGEGAPGVWSKSVEPLKRNSSTNKNEPYGTPKDLVIATVDDVKYLLSGATGLKKIDSVHIATPSERDSSKDYAVLTYDSGSKGVHFDIDSLEGIDAKLSSLVPSIYPSESDIISDSSIISPAPIKSASRANKTVEVDHTAGAASAGPSSSTTSAADSSSSTASGGGGGSSSSSGKSKSKKPTQEKVSPVFSGLLMVLAIFTGFLPLLALAVAVSQQKYWVGDSPTSGTSGSGWAPKISRNTEKAVAHFHRFGKKLKAFNASMSALPARTPKYLPDDKEAVAKMIQIAITEGEKAIKEIKDLNGVTSRKWGSHLSDAGAIIGDLKALPKIDASSSDADVDKAVGLLSNLDTNVILKLEGQKSYKDAKAIMGTDTKYIVAKFDEYSQKVKDLDARMHGRTTFTPAEITEIKRLADEICTSADEALEEIKNMTGKRGAKWKAALLTTKSTIALLRATASTITATPAATTAATASPTDTAAAIASLAEVDKLIKEITKLESEISYKMARTMTKPTIADYGRSAT